YQESVLKSHRTDGKALLMQVASHQERWYTENMSYASTMTALGFPSDPQPSDSGHYTVSILTPTQAQAAIATPCPIATCFVAVATPVGGQVKDGKLAVTSTGATYHDANNNGSYGDGGEKGW
ncbi:MAG: type IV pilin protein, partial [Magnetococcales bacterium]|nr:type IV pilin protein [Magnetococcales bacterium]